MKKQFIQKEIFKRRYAGAQARIPVGDIPKDLLPTDTLFVISDEGFYSENNSWDPYTELIIYRLIEETDAEFEERKAWWAEKKEESRKKRYAEYLKLKHEVEEGRLTRGKYEMTPEEEKEFNLYSDLKFNVNDRNKKSI